MPVEYKLLGGFDRALAHLQVDGVVSREGWDGRDMWLKLQRPDENSLMTLPYIYICTAQGDLVPWAPSMADLMAFDWHAVDFDH